MDGRYLLFLVAPCVVGKDMQVVMIGGSRFCTQLLSNLVRATVKLNNPICLV